jgi:6,7-dimethyl-8-ribityllumazine synthase
MNKKICIINSNYYKNISNNLLKGAFQVLDSKKITKVKIINVPGVFEIPIIISKNINKYDAFIALGCVIKGETPHFKFISEATIDALMQISINKKKPIGNGVLTCLNKKQALSRSDPNKKNKGGEAANATIAILTILK